MASTIGALSKAVGMRSVPVPGYASVDHRIVWGVVQGDLVPLLAELDSSLGEAP